MAESVAIDTREITITPLFRWETVEDVNQSERQGQLVKRMIQVVEVRFAGSKNYAPVFPVDAFWQRQNGRIVTYAERWGDQFRAFLEGNAQEAQGTPLEMLKSHGISDSHLSLCRALRIYSIEALFHLEGDALKNLGMASNVLKEMARSYMADRAKNGNSVDEIEKLRAEIEALKANQILAKPGAEPQTTEVVMTEKSPDEVEAAVAKSDAEFLAMDDATLKAFIKSKLGRAPTGTPTHEWLVNAAKEAQELAA